MKMKIFTFFILFVGMLYTETIVAQTIINYQTWTGASGCNIFSSAVNVPATINGSNATIAHRSNIGQPAYSAAVVLDCNAELDVNGNTIGYKGTEYRLTYNFKQGYNYKITINAACVNSGTSSYASLRLLPNSGGSGTSTQCNGAENIDPNLSGNLYMSKTMTSTYSDHVYDYAAFASAQSLLDVAAVPPIGSSFQTITIRKITIEEIAPPVSFALAPATLSIACGSTTPQTFTVSNVYSTPGVTAYNWNLGSGSNGWLYNGSPAPSTIVTTASALTLTPVCQAAHANIAVSVTAGGNNYPAANNSTVTTTIPVYSITGDEVVCSSPKSFSINTLPCGATVSWSSSNSNVATISSSGNPATVTRVGSSNGTIVITGVISGSCGTAPVTKPLTIGAPQTSNLYADWDNPLKIIVGADAVASATSYKWYVNNVYIKSTTYYNTSLPYSGNCTTSVTVGVEVVTSCGTSARKNYNIGTAPCDNYYTITPNPAQDIITISADEPSAMAAKAGVLPSSANSIAQVKIFNSNGTVLKSIQYTETVKQVQVNVASLVPGIYFIEVSNGIHKRTKRLLINR
mgnify:CR=1 FL=1